MADLIYDRAVLQETVDALPTPVADFLGRLFRRTVVSQQDEIFFDVEGTDLKLAPFVHPRMPGQNVVGAGFQTKSFRPAYVKDRAPFSPDSVAMGRQIGEPIGGNLTPSDRLERAVALELRQKRERLDRRLRWMAVQALYYGRVTVEGDYYPSTIVDFGRSGANTVVKTAGSKWTDSGVNPITDLNTWSDLAEAPISDWYMTTDAFAAFRANAEVQKRMDSSIRGSSTITNDAVMDRNAITSMGIVDGYRIHVIPRERYVDKDGATQDMVPMGTVIGVAEGSFEGVRHFGAIRDIQAIEGKFAGEYFIKSWLEQDPSARIFLLQSAPLMVPYRPNSTLRATVL